MRPIKNGHRYWSIIPVLLSVGIGSCGSTTQKQNSSPSATTQQANASAETAPVANANTAKHEPLQGVDGDQEGVYTTKLILGGRYDTDDTSLLNFGQPANAADRRAITTLVGRYHAAVASNDGPKGCALLHPLLEEGTVEDSPLPPGAHKKTCGAILTILFRQTHERKAYDAKKLHVMQVQIRHREAIALLGSHNKVEHSIGLRLQRNTWKIAEINEKGIP